MKAILIRAYGDWRDVMRLEDVERPTPGPGEVLVEVRGVTVNRTRDTTIIKGIPPVPQALPLVPGVDPAGIVAELGDGVTTLSPGDRVVVISRTPCGRCAYCAAGQDGDCHDGRMLGVHRWGGYAELIAAPAESCRRIPDSISLHEATVFMRHCPTALQLLDDKAGLKAGDRVLVMGAGGGLGSTGVQIARLMGATVIAGAGADERVQVGLDLGADYGVNYRRQDLATEVMRLTGGRGVDVVFENISDPTTWPRAFECLAYGGRLVTAGAHGGGTVPLDARRLYTQRLRVIGGAGSSRRNVDMALELAASGSLRCVIDAVMPLSALPEAFDLIGENRVSGKIVIDPALGPVRLP